MALDARTEIEEADWHLAGHVMAVSAATREQCRRALTDHRRIENTARALAVDERDEIVAERKSQRAREAILRKLSRHQQLTTGELRRSLKVDIRDYYDAALAELLDSGEIVISPGTRGNRKVLVYHRYTPEEASPTSDKFRVPPVHGYPRRALRPPRVNLRDTDRFASVAPLPRKVGRDCLKSVTQWGLSRRRPRTHDCLRSGR